MAINRNSENFDFGSYGNGGASQSGAGTSGEGQQVQQTQDDAPKLDKVKDEPNSDENSSEDFNNNDELDSNEQAQDLSEEKNSVDNSNENIKSSKSSDFSESESQSSDSKKSKIKDKSSKNETNSNLGGENSEEMTSQPALMGGQKGDLKDKAQKATIAAKVAGAGAKVGMAATVVNTIKNLVQLIIAIIRNIINAIVSFISSVATAIAGAFVSAVSFVASGLAVSTMVATFLLAGILAIVPVAASVAAYQYAQDLNTRRVDGDCVGRGMKHSSDKGVEAQAEELATYAEEQASHDPPYKYVSPSNDIKKVDSGLDCSGFVTHCFYHCNSEIITGKGGQETTSTLYDDYDDYKVDDTLDGNPIPADSMKRGDVLLFSAASDIKTKETEHTAIYLGEDRIAHAESPSAGIRCLDLKYDEKTGKAGYSGKYIVKVIRPYKASSSGASKEEDSSGVQGSSEKFKVQCQIYSILKKKGFKDDYIAAFLGNVQQECDFNPSCDDKGVLGLTQFYGSEADHLKKTAHQFNNDKWQDPAFQMGYLLSPLSNKHGGSECFKNINKWASTKWSSLHECAAAFDGIVEVSGESHKSGGGWACDDNNNNRYKYTDNAKALIDAGKYKTDKDFISKTEKWIKTFNAAAGAENSVFDFEGAEVNSELSKLNADDGCGGKVKDNTKETGVAGSVASDENATWIAYDEEKLEKEIGKQAESACGTWAQAYATFIISGGKKHSSLESTSMQHIAGANYRWTNQHVSWETRAGLIWDEVVENKRPVVVAGQGSGPPYNNHFTTVIGVRKGVTKETVKPTDWVILDPYQSDAKSRRNFYGSHDWMKGFDFNGSGYGHQTVTYEGYK